MSRKLYDQIKSEKSSHDHHHEITKSEEDNTLKSYWNNHKPGNYGRATEEDELVKYMSNLPRYLERGKMNREKVLNVGVLDWARLEQWQYSHKHEPHRISRSSTSSNASSSVSTDFLSGRLSRDNSCCSSGQRKKHPSLQSHFMASPMQGHSQAVKSSRESVGNYQNYRGSHISIDTDAKCLKSNDHLSQNHPNSRLEGCHRKYLNPYVDKGTDFLPNSRMYEAASCSRMGIRSQDGGLEKRAETLSGPNIDTVVQGTSGKTEPVALHLPRDSLQNSHCRVPHMQTSLVQKLENSSQMSFEEKPKELYYRDLDYDISHSCPLPDELCCDHSQYQGSGPSSTDLESIEVPASTFSSPLSTLSSPMSVKMRISPSRFRKSDEKKRIVGATSSSNVSLQGSDPKETSGKSRSSSPFRRLSPSRFRKSEEKKPTVGTTSSANRPLQGSDPKVTSEKSRSSSPFCRLSISIGHSSKGSVCKVGEHLPYLISTPALKCNSEDVRGYAIPTISGSDKPGDACRRRSSPLRRLLDPLLKSKTTKSRPSVESTEKDSMFINKNISSNGNFSSQKPDKEVDRGQRVGCSSVNAIDSSMDKKHAPSVTQALLRIAVRNGTPLFTFGVANTDSNILAATVKILSPSGKDECNCIYTFFTFREAKKKNGSWINQAGRSRGHEYVSHVIAQMKVSDSHNYDPTGQGCVDSSTMKEFVLISVKLGQGDAAEASDYQPNDELAAIVVKIPKAMSFINDRHQSSYRSNSQDLVHATVLLPSGVHSLPSKGGPSSLIERWKSGGSCDCGGWDLACKLKILSNENQASRKPRSSKAYFADQHELFLQGNEQEHRCAFSFTPLKHGMYSVAFDSSLSLLQAFSICIALVDSKMPYGLSGARSSIEGKIPRETLLVQSEELKTSGKLEDIPASYVSYPPHSPVGRV